MRLLKNWEHVQLGHVCSKIGSGATPRGGESVYVKGGTAIIRSQNVYNGSFSPDGLAHLTEEHAEQLKGVTVEPRDVLLNITGDSVARCCQVPDWVLPARVNQHVAIVRSKSDLLLPEFLCYYFVSPLMQRYLLSIAGSGGTRNALTKGMIESFDIPCPPVPIQQRIVELLKRYDDFIKNNQRRIQLLEQAARLLYKEWFVLFRFPGHEHVKIKDGVPEGWTLGTIADIGEVVTGKTPSKKKDSYYGDDIPFIKTPDMHGNTLVFKTDESLSEEGANTQANKTLPLRSILVSCIGTVGAVSFNSAAAQTNQQINAIVPKDESLSYWAFFMAKDLKPLLEGMGGGATMANVNKSKFSSIKVVIPSGLILDQFNSFVSTQIDQIERMARMNLQLVNARELLLPRLMNGEVAV